MDLSYNETQDMLRDSLARFLGELASIRNSSTPARSRRDPPVRAVTSKCVAQGAA